jgi:hypothetical protein
VRRIIAIAIIAVAALAGCGGDGGDGEREGDRDASRERTAAAEDVPFDTSDWSTDFSQHSAPFSEFVGGGPPKDGIPSIDDPKFVPVGKADEFLTPREPVAVVELGGEARAYPFQILIWHEIVNDEIAGEPVAVTYCPLCNSTVVFRRELEGRAVEFGTTGMLRNSDLVMYDRETESWWQQITAEAVVGELTGEELEVLPSRILSWGGFRRAHPDGQVLSRDTGVRRDYGSNPYAGYDSDPDSHPFLLRGEADRSLPPKERVAAIRTGERSAVVYPFSRLNDEAPINDVVEGRPLIVFFDPNVASALDASSISGGRSVGSTAVFSRIAKGRRTLSFEAGSRPGAFRDTQTGSTWNMSGEATAGPLQGTRLEPVPHDDQFWFALAAFFEDVEIRR